MQARDVARLFLTRDRVQQLIFKETDMISLHFYSPRRGQVNLTNVQRSDRLNELTAQRSTLQSERNAILKEITAGLVAEWIDRGGCQNCHGHERVVTWSTLDGPGWTEYGECPQCTPRSKEAGREPGSGWAGGYSAALSHDVSVDFLFRSLFDRPTLLTQAILLNTYDFQIDLLSQEIEDEEDRCEVAKGKVLEVVAGRKVPRGVTGECIWIGDNGYGLRIGLKTSAGETHWTAITNVRVAQAAA